MLQLGPFSICGEQRLLFSCGTQASYRSVFSCCRARALGHRLSSCVCRVSCSTVCGIFPDQGWDWQADSLLLSHFEGKLWIGHILNWTHPPKPVSSLCYFSVHSTALIPPFSLTCHVQIGLQIVLISFMHLVTWIYSFPSILTVILVQVIIICHLHFFLSFPHLGKISCLMFSCENFKELRKID